MSGSGEIPTAARGANVRGAWNASGNAAGAIGGADSVEPTQAPEDPQQPSAASSSLGPSEQHACRSSIIGQAQAAAAAAIMAPMTQHPISTRRRGMPE